MADTETTYADVNPAAEADVSVPETGGGTETQPASPEADNIPQDPVSEAVSGSPHEAIENLQNLPDSTAAPQTSTEQGNVSVPPETREATGEDVERGQTQGGATPAAPEVSSPTVVGHEGEAGVAPKQDSGETKQESAAPPPVAEEKVSDLNESREQNEAGQVANSQDYENLPVSDAVQAAQENENNLDSSQPGEPAPVEGRQTEDENTTTIETQPQLSDEEIDELIQRDSEGNLERENVEKVASLDDVDRRRVASKLLGREVTDEQWNAIQKAHNFGEGEVYEYTPQENAVKLRRLIEDGGFSTEEAKMLTDAGIVGGERIASRVMKGEELTTKQENGWIHRLNNRLSDDKNLPPDDVEALAKLYDERRDEIDAIRGKNEEDRTKEEERKLNRFEKVKDLKALEIRQRIEGGGEVTDGERSFYNEWARVGEGEGEDKTSEESRIWGPEKAEFKFGAKKEADSSTEVKLSRDELLTQKEEALRALEKNPSDENYEAVRKINEQINKLSPDSEELKKSGFEKLRRGEEPDEREAAALRGEDLPDVESLSPEEHAEEMRKQLDEKQVKAFEKMMDGDFEGAQQDIVDFNKALAESQGFQFSEDDEKVVRKFVEGIFKSGGAENSREALRTRRIREKFQELARAEYQLRNLAETVKERNEEEKKLKTQVNDAEKDYINEEDTEEKQKKLFAFSAKATQLSNFQDRTKRLKHAGREVWIKQRQVRGYIHRKLGTKNALYNLAFGAGTAMGQGAIGVANNYDEIFF